MGTTRLGKTPGRVTGWGAGATGTVRAGTSWQGLLRDYREDLQQHCCSLLEAVACAVTATASDVPLPYT